MELIGSFGSKPITRQKAMRREKQVKEWRRGWKINFIEPGNPHWIDLNSP
jgi:putative endonuclease